MTISQPDRLILGPQDRLIFEADPERFSPLVQLASSLMLALLAWIITIASIYALSPLALTHWLAEGTVMIEEALAFRQE